MLSKNFSHFSLFRWHRGSFIQLRNPLQRQRAVGSFQRRPCPAERCCRRSNILRRNIVHRPSLARRRPYAGENSPVARKSLHSIRWHGGCHWKLWDFDWELNNSLKNISNKKNSRTKSTRKYFHCDTFSPCPWLQTSRENTTKACIRRRQKETRRRRCSFVSNDSENF